jgi:hypothetical protein
MLTWVKLGVVMVRASNLLHLGKLVWPRAWREFELHVNRSSGRKISASSLVSLAAGIEATGQEKAENRRYGVRL